MRADVRSWQQEVYLGHETRSLSDQPLFGPKEWGWLITQFKDKGPQFQNALGEDIVRDKVLTEMPGAEAWDLIKAALESGVIMPQREMRHYPKTGDKSPYFFLQLNEMNSRVQVYLGLEMRPATVVVQSPRVPPASQAPPETPKMQQSPADRYRTYLKKAGMTAINLSRREREEILRLFHDFLRKPQAERPYKEQIADFLAICTAMNPSWSKNRVRSLVNLAFRTYCLSFVGSLETSPASLADGLSIEELIRRCDMRCVNILLGKEPSLDMAQAAVVLFDSEQHEGELKRLIEDVIRADRIREEEGKLVLIQQGQPDAEEDGEDAVKLMERSSDAEDMEKA